MTPTRLPASSLVLAFLLVCAPRVSASAPASEPASQNSAALQSSAASAVASVLSSTSSPSVRLLSASLVGQRLTLNFNAALLDLDPGSLAFEQFMRPLHRAVSDVLSPHFSNYEVITLIDGVPLDRVLDLVDPVETRTARAAAADVAASASSSSAVASSSSVPSPSPSSVATESAPLPLPVPIPVAVADAKTLASRRIALSPGHGYYLKSENNWVLQRSYYQGIVEDFINHELITVLRDELVGLGASVLPMRTLDRDAGIGESGHPKWQEAARYHAKNMGAPASVWNESGYTHYDQDIRTRPKYANLIESDILVSLHNNGGGGTGTETIYDNANTCAAESLRLANAIHNSLISSIRANFNAAWTDRKVKGYNGSYGENRIATRPSVIVELAFMDYPTPDNAALQNESFRKIAMKAIREGIEAYYAGTPAAVPPAPSSLIAAAGPSVIGLSWSDPATNENGFRIERRTGSSSSWETLASVGPNVTAFADYAVTAGSSYSYRVIAFNALGSSTQYSNEASASPFAVITTSRLANISLRTSLSAGQSVSLGFVVSGNPRPLLVRVAGPALASFGVSSAMTDPRIELFTGAGSKVTENDNWSSSLGAVFSAFGAFSFDRASGDAALQHPIQGAYTIAATGSDAGTILVEGYDTGSEATGRIVNLSARNRVGTGSDILIAGFHIAGTGTKKLLIRAVGPTLASFGVSGVLSDPKLQVFDASGAKLAEDDNWNPSLAASFTAVSAFPLEAGSRDAALVLTLEAGRSYTAQVSGVSGLTGEALVEVYEIQ